MKAVPRLSEDENGEMIIVKHYEREKKDSNKEKAQKQKSGFDYFFVCFTETRFSQPKYC